jgi:hypothetical protein
MNLTKYVVAKWNKDADVVDKLKVSFFTLIATGVAAILTTQGLITFLNPIDPYIAALISWVFFVLYFHIFRLWFIGRILIGITPDDEKKNVKT